MAEKGTFQVNVDNDLRGCAILLKSVACEWLLIFFLLVDAVYLYFLTKFAKYCNLQLPCILCSRLDHIFGNEKPDFYKDLICNDHRSKLSSLVFCHIHGSLADVHGICEECLLSFATKKDSSPEIYKFLLGKLGLDGLRNPMSEMDFFHGFVSLKSCTCCNKQWRCRPNVQKLMKSQSFGSRSSKPDNIPLPSPPRQKYLNRRDAVKPRDRFDVSTTPIFLGFPEGESMSPMGYTKLRVSCDSESDFLFDDDDDGIREHNGCNHLDQQGPNFSKKQFEDCFKTKQVNSPRKMSSDIRIPPPSKPVMEHTESGNNSPLGQKFHSSSSPRHDFSTSRDVIQLPTTPRPSTDQDEKVIGDAETWESCDLVTPKHGGAELGADLEIDVDKKDGITIPHFHIRYNSTSDHHNGTKVASEQVARKDQNGINKRANLSSPRLSDDKDDSSSFSFKMNGYADESFRNNVTRQKSPSIERSQSDLSLSELCGDKIEGETLIDQLRREVEEDRNSIDRLRKELEEERSASAEAANQAMAMITKLQEEKAVLNMDAQQYLRMMEEQAEHDLYALEKANDLLAEKEKEIQDLEAELEFYRLKYPDEYEEEFAHTQLLSQGLGMAAGKGLGFEGLRSFNKDSMVAESPYKNH